ncbi:metal-sulfur cluster assembly factor [Nitriliruptor alkaliphilus]|uniref:metal-sulfur cluster assembly factor n=1 Tax=Nitriliruptor alkaliphilus TaxID=427918 RepID=UPI0006961D80|nr:metal-sulfur cluster assembly factor [Nitriliruptor alkaliphilus]
MTPEPRGNNDGSVEPGRLWGALSAVEDPELPISLVDLGLVRELEVHDGHVRIGLTYTSLACPCVEIIKDDVRDAIAALPEVRSVQIDDVLEAWSRDDVSPAGLEALRVVAVL